MVIDISLYYLHEISELFAVSKRVARLKCFGWGDFNLGEEEDIKKRFILTNAFIKQK